MRFMWTKVLLLLLSGVLSTGLLAATQNLGILFYMDSQMVSGSTSRSDLIELAEEWVNETNDYYDNTKIDLSLFVAKVVVTDISQGRSQLQASSILSDAQQSRGAFTNAMALADEYGADYIYTVTSTNLLNDTTSICGQAIAVNQSINAISQTNRSLAISRRSCGARTFAHELGHLMGLSHGEWVSNCVQDGSDHRSALTSYAKGFGSGDCGDYNSEQGDGGTIMTGNYIRQTLGGGLPDQIFMVPIFSNLRVSFGGVCGTGQNAYCGNGSYANAARVLDEHRNYYGSHEHPDAHAFSYEDSALAGCISDSYRGQEVGAVTSLTCYGLGIEALGGIENLTALSVLNLAENPIRSVQPLLEFKNSAFSHLDLSGIKNLTCSEHAQLEAKFGDVVYKPDQCFPLTVIITSSLMN